MDQRPDALVALAQALANSAPSAAEDAWLAAAIEAAGTKYERRLLEAAAALRLDERDKALETVEGILDDFEGTP